MRALCNGKTLAFQAKDAGSIPAARSTHTRARKLMPRNLRLRISIPATSR
jgi:hypothetical protein